MTTHMTRPNPNGLRPHRRGARRGDEHHLQAACVSWFRLQYPSLAYALFAVPNGGRRDAATGRRLKEEGVLPGVADLILLHSAHPYGALLIEMKTPRGHQSPTQKQWQHSITSQGTYKYIICRTLREFIDQVTQYLKTA